MLYYVTLHCMIYTISIQNDCIIFLLQYDYIARPSCTVCNDNYPQIKWAYKVNQKNKFSIYHHYCRCYYLYSYYTTTIIPNIFLPGMPVVSQALDGFNGTIFAYGQTGSGKSWSMIGAENNKGKENISDDDRCNNNILLQ